MKKQQRRKKQWMAAALLFLLAAFAACGKQTDGNGENDSRKIMQSGENAVEKETEDADFSTDPHTKEDGGKYHIAYVDYDEYLPASQQFYYILMGLKEQGWITCSDFPFTADSMSTKEMIAELSEMDLGRYLEFSGEYFYYLSYEDEDKVRKKLLSQVENGEIDLVITFGTSAGLFVKNLDLPVPMVDFSATDPVASGIIASAEQGSGNDMVWAQVEPSMPLRQLKYYHSIKSFECLGIVVYGDETISGVPDIEKAAEEIGFTLKKHNLPEQKRETKREKKEYYEKVRQEFLALCEEGIDAFFLMVDLINDRNYIRELLSVFYKEQIPVYVMDDAATVKNGALLIISTYDFESVGRFIADAVAKILNGAVAGDLPCTYVSSPYICLHYDVAKEIEYPLDFKFLLSCDEIYREN